MEKVINVVVPGADETAQLNEVVVYPGNTVRDMLHPLGKDPNDWTVYIRTEQGDETLSAEEDLYERIGDGQKVFLETAKMVVG